jgi:hypothetical protein
MEPSKDPQAADEVEQDYYQRKAKPLPSDSTLGSLVVNLLEQGYVVIPDAFAEAEALEAMAEIDHLHGANPRTGRYSFDGFMTNRIFALLGKTRVFDKFCLLP